MSMAPQTPAAETPAQQEPAPAPMTLSDMTTLAHNYHVPMSEGTLAKMAAPHGELSPEKAKGFEDYLKTTAAGLYPTLAPQIKAGIPTAFLLDPYRQVGKQVLGDDFEPNFHSDPNARAALDGGFDPQTQRPAPMSLTQWQQHLKSDPSFGYMNTPQGQQEKAQMMAKIQTGMQGGQ